jgi:hypothetical protein
MGTELQSSETPPPVAKEVGGVVIYPIPHSTSPCFWNLGFTDKSVFSFQDGFKVLISRISYAPIVTPLVIRTISGLRFLKRSNTRTRYVPRPRR